MWRTIYNIRFSDDDNGQWLVEVQSEDAAAAVPVELTPAGNPLEWMNNGRGELGQCVLGGTGTLNIAITQETMSALMPGNLLPVGATDRRVVVTRNGNVVWQGFIQPQTFDQDWEAAPYDIEVPLADNVEVLSNIYVDDSEKAVTTIELLYSAYQRAGGELPMDDFIRTNQPQYWGKNGATSLSWSQVKFSSAYFSAKEDDNDRFSYADVIDVLLSPHGMLMQTGTRWFVGAVNTIQRTLSRWRPAAEEFFPWVVAESAGPEDITRTVAGAENRHTLVSPPGRVTLRYNPEPGKEDFSGDSIISFTPDYIWTRYAFGYVQDVIVDEQNRKYTILRYLKIKKDAIHAPFTKTRHKWTTRYVAVFNPVSHANTWTPDPETEMKEVSTQEQGYAQGIEIDMAQMVKTRNPLCLLHSRVMTDETYPISDTTWRSNVTLTQTVDTLRLKDELYTTDKFCLKFTAKMMHPNQTDDAAVEPGKSYGVTPMVQFYWSDTKDGTPKKYLRWERQGQDTVSSWADCDGFFTPSIEDVDPVLYIPHSALAISTLNDGFKFNLPSGRGYLSMRIYAGGWIYEGDHDLVNRSILLINGYQVLTDFSLQYEEVNRDAIHLAEWNKGVRDVRHEYTGGVGDLTLDFKTNAGEEPTAATFRAPERGFNDGPGRAGKMSEMIDIGAVQVTHEGDIPGITRFSLFEFDGKTYFPAATGMNARENTVALKLIRTI